jgi:hypothetical protein
MPQTGAWPVAVVLAAASCVCACGAASTATTPSTATSTPASPSTPANPSTPASPSTPANPSTPASQGQSATAAIRSTPGAALANWIHQVAAGDRSAACDDMAAPEQSSALATCMSSGGTATFTAFHSNFVVDGIRPSTPIRVTGSHVTGSNATINGSDVWVSGTTMDTLVAEHSTGIKAGQVSLSFVLSRVDGAWYVINMNMNAS